MDIAISSDSNERKICQDGTHELVSRTAYPIGVPKRILENTHESPKQGVFAQMNNEKNIRIIRHLSIIRTSAQRSHQTINRKMKTEYLSILSMPEYTPVESMHYLESEGIYSVRKSGTKLLQHIIELNRIISNRINNYKPFFPPWLNWKYIQDPSTMSDGLSKTGTKNAATLYYQHKQDYPYQTYMNWNPSSEGSILYNDKKSVILLYRWHGDTLTEYNRVSDVGIYAKGSIQESIGDSTQAVIVVDCENSDPCKLCATLKGLDYRNTAKISKILLFDDIHTTSAWRILDNSTRISIEHILTEHVKQNKSLIDIKLTAGACQERYQNHVDSFIIVSSDSDYRGLISSLPEVRFLAMVEREKCSHAMRQALAESGISYYYIDDFYSGNADGIKTSALFKEMYRYSDHSTHLNVNDIFAEALHITRLTMAEAEKRQFYDKYTRPMHLVIDSEGNISIKLKRQEAQPNVK